MIDLNLIKIFLPVLITFLVGIGITPFFTGLFYKYKAWKHSPRTENRINGEGDERKNGVLSQDMSEEYKKIHNTQAEVSTPRIGGMIIWVSIVISTILLFILAEVAPSETTQKLNFVSKEQTLLPFIALIIGALIGLADDFMTMYIKKGKWSNGFPRSYMIGLVFISGLVFGLWFFLKLDVSSIALPFTDAVLNLGFWFVPVFILIFLMTFSSGVIDGIDGLAGGVVAITFAALGTIAFFQNQVDIAAFSLVISGAMLAFLWFNIPPARFYLGETGMLGLTFTMVLIVFLTDTVLILPIIGLPLALTSISSFVQIISKKFRGPEGKILKVAPLHHHFEAIGWSREKITMRYWILSVVFAVIGVIIALL